MDDLVEEMRRFIEMRGDTYSSMEMFGMMSRAANEIERLREYVRSSASAGCATAKQLLSE